MTVGQHIYNSEGDFRHVDIDGTHGFWGGDGHQPLARLQAATVSHLHR